MTRVAMMGGGSWGTAFAMVLADAGSDVQLWTREAEAVTHINVDHTNPKYQPGIDLPKGIRASLDPAEVLHDAELVILAIPAQSLRANLMEWCGSLAPESVLVSLMKGIELGTQMRMSQVIEEVADVPAERVAVVSGPNLAREIAQRQPAATTVACVDRESARQLQKACTTGYFRPYWTTDVVGAEIGGSVKNVIALANGIAAGMGLGENSQASLITRGLAEMTRLGTALGADPLTFMGLAGVGDLIATCSSPLSRNRTFGEMLGKGLTVGQAIAEMSQTCEAYKSCEPILELGQQHGIEMPITEQVVNVVHRGASVGDMGMALMSRDTKSEAMTTLD